MTPPRWGVVSTIKAPTEDVLQFVAYHLDLGAAEIAVFLDDSNKRTAKALSGHPNVKVISTDLDHWKSTMGRRPVKHQVRQVRNASYYYRRAKHLDWLCHIDVDEFLCPEHSVADSLAACPDDLPVSRVRPTESLCIDGLTDIDPSTTYCKARLPGGPEGRALEQKLYPHFGGVLKSGFVSHVVGKIFVRTGLSDVKFGIHRAFENKSDDLNDMVSADMELCHRHIENWEKWLQVMAFRLERGSYRSDLEQTLDPLSGRIQRHKLFTSLTEDGTGDLRAFFEEVCLATPRLRAALQETGYLRKYRLDLGAKQQRYFPDFV
ncbi:glycosyltransferase family 2 protein [Cognatishimia maritima]|uniref:Glycosyl transferase family 2 n=1 Tax=Cognatishimia maritima TaxID=870908 RepID=A0A1M5W6M3_9RHOB|nr:glycosyltransferase family 2 protein [Cognatishimia maritima]SHH83130.1 Glycosyl transferase family 2 [Cognatishimia maritima]